MGHPVFAIGEAHVSESDFISYGQVRDSEDPIVKRYPTMFTDDWTQSPHAVFAPRRVIETATAAPGETRRTKKSETASVDVEES